MKVVRYVPDMIFVLHDVKEEDIEQIIYHHSDKLVIDFGLLNTTYGITIRVVNNFRVYGN